MNREDELREEAQYRQLHGHDRYPVQQKTSGCWKFLVFLVVLAIIGYVVFHARLGLPWPE